MDNKNWITDEFQTDINNLSNEEIVLYELLKNRLKEKEKENDSII